MKKSIVKILGEFINKKFDESSPNNDELIEYLKGQFSGAVETVTIKNSNGFNNLLVGVNTCLNNVKGAVVLSGHMDTICPSQNYVNDFVVKNGIVYGLGACDMKAFIAELIYKFELLKSQQYPIIISLTCDEETTVEGVQNVLKYFLVHNITGKYFVIGEPTDNKICSWHKGMVDIAINISGKSAHSSAPSLGINAIYIASHFASGIEELDKKFEPCGSSLNVSKISGGKSSNSVAQCCSVYMDFRAIDNSQYAKIFDGIYSLKNSLESKYNGCSVDIDIKFNLPCFQKYESKITELLSESLHQTPIAFNAWTEAGYLSKIIPDGIIFGAGSLEFAHKDNEQVSISQLETYDKNFETLLNVLAF